MKLLKACAGLLELGGLGTIGKDIFWFHTPVSSGPCVLLLPSVDGIERNDYMPGYFKADFRAVVRGTDYDEVVDRATRVVDALDVGRANHSDVHFKRSRATQEPIIFPLPTSDIIEATIPMWAAYVVDPDYAITISGGASFTTSTGDIITWG